MSERQEKLAIAAAKSTGGRARASLEHLQRRWGRLHRKPELAIGDHVFLETMGAPELWRVTGVSDGVWLEQEDVMTHLRVIQGQGKPERPCLFCGEKWDGEDDQNHGAHNREAECSHMGIFNCQLKMIGSYCACPPSGPAYPRQPHEAKYELDTAGNMRKVVEVPHEPIDHREEVGGFKSSKRSLEEIITATAEHAAGSLTAPTAGSPPPDVGAVLEAARDVVDQAVAQAMAQAGIPPEAAAAEPDEEGEQLAWVKVDTDGFSCGRCGLWATIPDDPTLAADALAAFEGEHLFCPEKSG